MFCICRCRILLYLPAHITCNKGTLFPLMQIYVYCQYHTANHYTTSTQLPADTDPKTARHELNKLFIRRRRNIYGLLHVRSRACIHVFYCQYHTANPYTMSTQLPAGTDPKTARHELNKLFIRRRRNICGLLHVRSRAQIGRSNNIIV